MLIRGHLLRTVVQPIGTTQSPAHRNKSFLGRKGTAPIIAHSSLPERIERQYAWNVTLDDYVQGYTWHAICIPLEGMLHCILEL